MGDPGTGLLAVLALLLPGSPAHGPYHERIAALTARIEREPEDASLRLARSDLYRLDKDWPAAAADLTRVAELDARLPELFLARARLERDMGWLEDAAKDASAFVEAVPAAPDGPLLLAEIELARGRSEPAIASYSKAIDLCRAPPPDWYLARARVQRDGGRGGESERLVRSLQGLDEGIGRLGPVASLVLEAVELERALHRWDAALERVAKLASRASRRESWEALSGDILVEAGRTELARITYEHALAAITALPPHARATRTTLELEARIRASLTALEGPRDIETRSDRP